MPEQNSNRQESSARTRTELVGAIEKGKPKRVRRILRAMHPAKAASLLESLTAAERSAAWDQIDSELELSLLQYLSTEAREDLIHAGDEAQVPDRDQRERSEFQRLWNSLEGRHMKRAGRILREAHPAKVAGFLESIPGDNRTLAW
jgi:magnesium transporter